MITRALGRTGVPARRWVAAWLLVGALLPAASLAQTGAGGAEIVALWIEPAEGGERVVVRSSGNLEAAAAYVDGQGALVVRLPGHRPGGGVRDLAKATGPVASVEITGGTGDAAPQTELLIRTRGNTRHSVVRQGPQLEVVVQEEVAPAASAPPPVAAVPPAARPAGVGAGAGDLDLQAEAMRASLERSNQARTELAAQLEARAVENEALVQRAELLDARRREQAARLEALEAELGRARMEAEAEARRQAEAAAAAAARERRMLEELEAAKTAGAEARRAADELAARLASVEAQSEARALTVVKRNDELTAAGARAAGLAGELAAERSARQQAEADARELSERLASESEENSRAGRHRRIAELESRNRSLETDNGALAEGAARLEAELEALRQRLAAAEEHGRSQRQELAALEERNRSLEETNRGLEARLRSLQEELGTLRRRGDPSADGTIAEVVETADPDGQGAGGLESTPPAVVDPGGIGLEPAGDETSAEPVEGAAPAALLARTTDRVNLRAAPEAGSERLGTLARGMTLEVLQRQPPWLELRVGQGTGWAAAEFFELGVAAAPPAAPRFGRTSVVTRLRAAPTTESANLGTLAAGIWVELLDSQGGWRRVRLGRREGWLLDRLLEPLEP